MKSEKEVRERLELLKSWMNKLDYNEQLKRLCGYYDVLQWVLSDKGKWNEDYGLEEE